MGNGGKKILKKQLVMLGIAILLLVVGLSGCEENNTTQNDDIDIEKMILGSWKSIEVTQTANGGYISGDADSINRTVTFYDNGTKKISAGRIYQKTHWGEYRIENNKLIGQFFYQATSCDFSISGDGKYLTCIWIGPWAYGPEMKAAVRFERIE